MLFEVILFTYFTIFILLAMSCSKVKKYTKREDKNSEFQYLLESPDEYYFGKEDVEGIEPNNQLLVTLENFCKKYNVFEKGAIVSLSGGVDSMVTLACLMKLAKKYNFPIYTASIDYSQRDEQFTEIEFLKRYCEVNGIKTYVAKVEGYSRRKENSGPRTEFEEESRKIRFELYKKIMAEHECDGVFVGHHKDDIIENIFTNSMKSGNLLDLEVMKQKSTIHGVNIYRPFLEYHKNVIFEIAHKNNIPYFLDTTPKWSRRGRMRFEIFPLLDNVFGTSWHLKLKDLGDQSNQWGTYILDYVVNPWVSEIQFGKFGFVMPFKEQPKLIYSNVILKAMHSMGKHMLKNSSIDKIMANQHCINKPIILDSGFIMFVDSNYPDKFMIINKDEMLKHRIAIVGSYRHYDYTLENLLNGYISYKQPDNFGKDYSINNKVYEQMETKISKEFLKIFMYRNTSESDKGKWININTV